MSLPFTAEQFLDVFRQYNTGVWPMQVVLTMLAVITVALALGGKARSGRLVALCIAVQWIWTGIAYHWWFFSRINPAARGFAVLWVAGAIAFAISGWGRGSLSFRTTRRWRMAVGATFVVYALVIYPALGYWGGRAYPYGPTYGAPCPVTICTFGLLWLARSPLPRYVLIAPILWAAVGSVAAFSLGVHEDLGLLPAGLGGFALLFGAPRSEAAMADTTA